MITISQSKTADTRTCDVSKVSKEQLQASSIQHIADILKGMQFFQKMLYESAESHDFDKLTEIDHFHSDFITGFKKTYIAGRYGKRFCGYSNTFKGSPVKPYPNPQSFLVHFI